MTRQAQWATVILVGLLTGCASRMVHSGVRPKSDLQPQPASEKTTTHSSWIRINLPYTYSRHGVELRVTSIEFSETQMMVSVTLQETREQKVDLTVSTLMQAVTSGGVPLPNAGYALAGKTVTDSEIHIAARDQFSVSLLFTIPPSNTAPVDNSFELRFPTGKYWSSRP